MTPEEEKRLSEMRQKGLITAAQVQGFKSGQNAFGTQSGEQLYEVYKTTGGKSASNKKFLPINGPTHFPGFTIPERPYPNSPIDDIYENSRASQLAALKGQYDTQTAEYEKQKSEAPKTFDPLRNEAYVNTEMAERSRKESMANMGLSGAGGTSQTLQQRNVNTLLSMLGGISRQQQDFTDNVNFALGQLGTQYDANTRSINAQVDSEKNKAYLDQGNWDKNYGLQQDQFNLTKEDTEFKRDFELYKKGLIKKKDFKKKYPEYF